MAKLSSLPMLLAMVCLVFLLVLPATWLIGTVRTRRKGDHPPVLMVWAKWLTAAAFLANLVMVGPIVAEFGSNLFQMLFGFSPQMRMLFAGTALLMGALALVLATLAAQEWQRSEGRLFDRSLLTAVAVVTLVYAISIAALG